jgi:quercetin 2,3-dioxygenase
MNLYLVQRMVSRVDTPDTRPGHSEAHRVRPLVEPGNWAAADPFLLLMEDWAGPGVFSPHPHRGIQTFTFLIEGELEHRDNHGYQARISAGDALLMTAGRGIVHGEGPADGRPVHLLQLWINLPRKDKLANASLQVLRARELPVRHEPGAELRVFSGRSGSAVAPTENYAAVTIVEVVLRPGATIDQELPSGYNGFVVVLEGDGAFGTPSTVVKESQVGWLSPHDEVSAVRISSGQKGMRAMVFSGAPLREPVAARGPFVMNTNAELDAGFAEFRSQGDRFGVPDQNSLPAAATRG